jgi:hypothetical protein
MDAVSPRLVLFTKWQPRPHIVLCPLEVLFGLGDDHTDRRVLVVPQFGRFQSRQDDCLCIGALVVDQLGGRSPFSTGSRRNGDLGVTKPVSCGPVACCGVERLAPPGRPQLVVCQLVADLRRRRSLACMAGLQVDVESVLGVLQCSVGGVCDILGTGEGSVRHVKRSTGELTSSRLPKR